MFYKILYVLLIVFTVLTYQVSAQTESRIISSIDINTENISFSSVYEKIKSGDVQLNPKEIITYIFSSSISEMKNILKNSFYIILVACLNAFISSIDISFLSKGIRTSVFLSFYALFIIVLMNAFTTAGNICMTLLENVCAIIKASVPVCISIMSSLGELSTKLALKPIYLYFLEIISSFSKNVTMPFINALFSISVVGCISEKFSVKNLIELLKKVIKWSMTIVLSTFLGSISIVGLVSDKIVVKGAKTVKFVLGNFVPVVGRLLSDTVDTVTASASLIKNTVGISGIVMLVIICLPPVIKLFAMSLSYKICASIIEPLSDRRLAGMLSMLSSSIDLMIGISISVSVVFAVAISVLLMIGG